MFVVRYLMVAVVAIVAVAAGGIVAGFSAWAVAGMALLALLVMQAGIVAYVVVDATRRDPRPPVPAARRSNHVVVLPR